MPSITFQVTLTFDEKPVTEQVRDDLYVAIERARRYSLLTTSEECCESVEVRLVCDD